MALAITAVLPPLSIDSDGAVRVGKTRVTLDTVVLTFKKGATAEEIVYRYPTLTLADVYSVLGYYLQHEAEVDGYLRERQRGADQIRQQNEAQFDPSGIRSRLLARRCDCFNTPY
jgi:uncharacterized protein (DUF433 family)